MEKYFALYVNSDFFFLFTNDHIEGYVEKDPEGSLRKSGIIHKQCLLKKSRKEAVLCIVSICHSSPSEYHPYDPGKRVSRKNSELII